jgi:hypothetical protein
LSLILLALILSACEIGVAVGLPNNADCRDASPARKSNQWRLSRFDQGYFSKPVDRRLIEPAAPALAGFSCIRHSTRQRMPENDGL